MSKRKKNAAKPAPDAEENSGGVAVAEPPQQAETAVEAPPAMSMLSLWQPWASLIALGEKKIETRDWDTDYRGLIAIHATKSLHPESHAAAQNPAIAAALAKHDTALQSLPLGAIVAVAEVVNTVEFTPGFDAGEPEKHFGNFTAGRFGLILQNVRPLAQPIPCAGGRKLVTLKPELAASILAAQNAPAPAKPDDAAEEDEPVFEIPARILHVVGVAAKDESKYAMTGVLIEADRVAKVVTAMATDGRRLMVATCNQGIFDGVETVYIPKSIARNAARVSTVRPGKDSDAIVTIRRDGDDCHLTAYTQDGPIVFEWQMDPAVKYPPYRDVIPDWSDSEGIERFGITGDLVASTITWMQKVVGKAPKIKVHLPSRPDRAFGFEAQDGETLRALAVMMPAVIDGWVDHPKPEKKEELCSPQMKLDGEYTTKPTAGAEPVDESWKATTLQQLGITKPRIVKALTEREPPLTTLGAIADWTREKGQYWAKDIKGIGDAAAEEITDACDKFWASRPAPVKPTTPAAAATGNADAAVAALAEEVERAAKFLKLDDDVLEVLRTQIECHGNNLIITGKDLNQKLYRRVDQALELLGGKWKGGKTKAHVFPAPPAESIAVAVAEGQILDRKKTFQFFQTPPELAARMVKLAELKPDQMVLEPSAGLGAIADVIRDHMPEGCLLECCELDAENCKVLFGDKDFPGQDGDFIVFDPGEVYDRILMTPPFRFFADVDHVIHAFDLLKPGGRIVAAMSSDAFTHTAATKAKEFQKWLESGPVVLMVEELPPDTFKGFGLMARLIVLEKPSNE